MSVRSDLKRELPYLKRISNRRVRASLEARTLSLSKKSFRQAAELFETLETFQKVV